MSTHPPILERIGPGGSARIEVGRRAGSWSELISSGLPVIHVSYMTPQSMGEIVDELEHLAAGR